jgi:hypothetical protein
MRESNYGRVKDGGTSGPPTTSSWLVNAQDGALQLNTELQPEGCRSTSCLYRF